MLIAWNILVYIEDALPFISGEGASMLHSMSSCERSFVPPWCGICCIDGATQNSQLHFEIATAAFASHYLQFYTVWMQVLSASCEDTQCCFLGDFMRAWLLEHKTSRSTKRGYIHIYAYLNISNGVYCNVT